MAGAESPSISPTVSEASFTSKTVLDEQPEAEACQEEGQAQGQEERERSRSRSRNRNMANLGTDEDYFPLNDPYGPVEVTANATVFPTPSWTGSSSTSILPPHPLPLPQLHRAALPQLHRAYGLGHSWEFGASMASFLQGHAGQVLQEMVGSMPHELMVDAQSVLNSAVNQGITLCHPPSGASKFIKDRLAKASHPFYIGITEYPGLRFQEHRSSGYRSMNLWLLENSRESGDLEMRLIAEWSKNTLCMNKSKGGECRSSGRPHFLYVVWKAH